jgi:hypothetical protein
MSIFLSLFQSFFTFFNFLAGTLVETLTSPLFRVPTTIARFGDHLYVVNARFGTPPTPDTEYEVVRVP